MKQLLGVVLAGGLLLVVAYVLFLPGERQQGTAVTAEVVVEETLPAVEVTPEIEALPLSR